MCSSRDSCYRSDMSQGCPVPVGNSICGETNSLEIMKEFNKLYEERMDQVDAEAGGDCSQEKIKLQQEWIKNLTQQNEMLVKAVQELEYEATERVRQLEDKLQKSAQCLCEVMKKYREHDFTADLLAEPLQNISRYEDDTRNLLEFIRRIRETGTWNLDGLSFYNVSKEDLLGKHCQYANKLVAGDVGEGEKLLSQKEKTVCELTEKINYYNTFGDIECMAKELQTKREECHNLKQEMADMRQVLTEEVAAKHDQIILLKKEIQVFEDRCVQADKQTAFKEDIIRELRKEIKQLKQQLSVPEKLPQSSNKHTSCALEKPYIVVNHTSKREAGKNTIIYINKDGSIHKEVQYTTSLESKDHSEVCSKCKDKLKAKNLLQTNCKSETDLAKVKSALKPVKMHTQLTNRSKTFVDQTKHTLNEFDFEESCVKAHISYLERNLY